MADTSSVALDRPGVPTRERRNCRRTALLATTALVAVTAFAPGAVRAQDATWLNTATIAGPIPGTFDFNASANWSPATVPHGTASFGASNTTALSFSANASVGGWTFNAGAPAYTFANNQLLTFAGAGIVINGGNATINNNIGGSIQFNINSTAGTRHHQRQLQHGVQQQQHSRQRHHH